MRVKMRTTMAGPHGVILAGKQGEVPDEQGKALVAAGYAERVEAPPPEEKKAEKESETPALETATAEPGETAMMDPPARRRRRRDA